MSSTKKICYQELTETASENKWTLYNFSSFNNLPNGKFVCSKTFLCNGIKWSILLYPNGINEDHRGYFSILLCCMTNIEATVDCEFIMSNRTKIYKSDSFTWTNEYDQEHMKGFNNFIDRETVFTDLKDPNDTLTIVVNISLSNATQGPNYLNLQEDLSLLLTNNMNSDVILVSKDKKEFKAHKAILACRSKVFSAMFQPNMKENQDNVVKIEDVDNETLEAMLNFVYTGELVLGMKNISKNLLVAAHKYKLNELKRMCINYLHANLDCDNVFDMMKIADTYNISVLKLKAKEYFLKNHKEILSTVSRKNLMELPRDIAADLLCDLSSVLSSKVSS